MAELPPNTVVNGRHARTLAVGYRRQESSYRARLWSGLGSLPVRVFRARDGLDDYALAPILDFTTEEVDEMLRHYGIADIVLKQYERWRRAPNCVLCPLQGKAAFRLALKNMPTQWLLNIKRILEELLPRYRDGTFSKQRIQEWIEMIDEELKARGIETENNAIGER
jgi:3'-phosphoadenosine 5'-phosphosulfate sulfotransferase (PAPS reductase)/FAD synthetase